MRSKLIGLAFAAVVAALVWYVGVKVRQGREVHPTHSVAASATQDGGVDTGVSTDLDASIADASDDADAEVEQSGLSAACLAMQTASQPRLDEAKDAGWCLDLSLADLGCKTSKNGATWGIRIDDVTDLEPDAASCPTGWLERVVHVAADGSEQATIPPGPGGVRNGHRYNVYKGAPLYVVTFFDWDGDGEDEAVIGRWTSIFVWTFKHGHIVPYAPASAFTVDDVKDDDGDGRPDLLVRPFGDAPTSMQLLAHALPDGTFTLHDAVAVKHAQTVCPTDAPVATGVREDILANDIACALLWGHDPKALRSDVCAADAEPCPAWVKRMLVTKPPLSLR
jgi:hypothetical protein